MPHGDFSDAAAFFNWSLSFATFMFPAVWTMEFGPIQPTLTLTDPSAQLLLNLAAGLFLILGSMLSMVRWNPVNGKPNGLVLVFVAGNFSYSMCKANDMQFVPTLAQAWCLVMLLCGFHLMTNTNPLIKAAAKSA